ncbi:formimidoylglutamate deiminase [Robbsia sp. Bb-Pol-6]|uniref:Formimidoylglutamate deiminase n=1 Tax=Robbsia betulipollinis TaxID=2981849 RepID=A0ABT3ZS78_9BURK|nr:formimidoylglutamate deiminase [Robbsia betulipollinis]MCY0389406.1 formimidoylglutamate deiminase [Robbsia betulipollinis]
MSTESPLPARDVATPSGLFAHAALLPDGWRRDVALHWNAAGELTAVRADTTNATGLPVARGPVLPGMPNLHSHAFQRAMAGLTETRDHPADSFWSWRNLMYRFASRLQPEDLEIIARHLYIEMLRAGYTSVCEFHYVHHAVGGHAYANPAEHAERVLRAAQDAGIGMTLLPVLYQYGGFGHAPPLEHQARFVTSPDWIAELLARLRRSHPTHATLQYGLAPHSLRAVAQDTLAPLIAELRRADATAPVHIHIAEQEQEVDACMAACGLRPVEALFAGQAVDAHWCLVHATHMSDAEYRMTARSGAIVGLCPTTEANLGDGVFDARRYFGDGGQWGIGSDSQVCVSPAAELRLLEYGQRLLHRRRNVLSSDAAPAVADGLYLAAVRGGAAASGRPLAGLATGQRADLVILDTTHPDFDHRPLEQLLSAMVFCEHGHPPVRDVFVAGRQVVDNGTHALQQQAAAEYRRTLAALLT